MKEARKVNPWTRHVVTGEEMTHQAVVVEVLACEGSEVVLASGDFVVTGWGSLGGCRASEDCQRGGENGEHGWNTK